LTAENNINVSIHIYETRKKKRNCSALISISVAYFALAHFWAVCYCCFTLSHCRNFRYFFYSAKREKEAETEIVAGKKLKFIYSTVGVENQGSGNESHLHFFFHVPATTSHFSRKTGWKMPGLSLHGQKTQKTFHLPSRSSVFFLLFFLFFYLVLACGSGCRYLYLNAACGSPLRLLLCNESLFASSNSLNLNFGWVFSLPWFCSQERQSRQFS